MTDLLNCPFCGGAADLSFEHSTKHPDWWKVTCTNCGNRTQSNTTHRERAIAAWNRRATPAALAASPEGQALIQEAEVRGMERVASLPVTIIPYSPANKAALDAVTAYRDAIRAEAAALKGKTT